MRLARQDARNRQVAGIRSKQSNDTTEGRFWWTLIAAIAAIMALALVCEHLWA